MDKKVGNRISVTEENPDVACLIRGWEIHRHLHKRLLSTRLPIRDFLSHLICLLKESEKSDQFYERMSQVANTVHNPALFDELLAPTYVLHLPGSPPISGIEQAKQLMVAYTSAFPDLQLSTEDVVAEGDKVAIRNTWRGTHHGAFQGLPPTGKHVTFSGSDFFRFVGGKIAEQWADLDALGLLQQLGGIPAMG